MINMFIYTIYYIFCYLAYAYKHTHTYIYIGTFISDYRRVLDWMTGFTDTLHNSGLQAIIAYRYFHTLQFTVTHALGFSVFTSRILATDL
jgi:hypothetical protein